MKSCSTSSPFAQMQLATITLACTICSQAVAERLVFPNDPSVLEVKRDFGAKGDGVADDTAALQAGIVASANRGKDGGTKILYLPNGTYRVTSNLVVKAAVARGSMASRATASSSAWLMACRPTSPPSCGRIPATPRNPRRTSSCGTSAT